MFCDLISRTIVKQDYPAAHIQSQGQGKPSASDVLMLECRTALLPYGRQLDMERPILWPQKWYVHEFLRKVEITP